VKQFYGKLSFIGKQCAPLGLAATLAQIHKYIRRFRVGIQAQLAALSSCCPYQRRQQKSLARTSHKCRDTRRYKSPNVPLCVLDNLLLPLDYDEFCFCPGPGAGKKSQGPSPGLRLNS